MLCNGLMSWRQTGYQYIHHLPFGIICHLSVKPEETINMMDLRLFQTICLSYCPSSFFLRKKFIYLKFYQNLSRSFLLWQNKWNKHLFSLYGSVNTEKTRTSDVDMDCLCNSLVAAWRTLWIPVLSNMRYLHMSLFCI